MNDAPPSRFGPGLLLVVGILGMSSSTLWARQSDAGATELAFRRLILTVPMLLLLTRGRVKVPPVEVARGPVLVSGICLAVHFAAYFASLERLPSAAVCLVFVSLHPVLLLAIEGLRGAVRFDVPRVAGVGLVTLGSVWLARDEMLRADGSLSGVALGVVSAIGMVGYLLAGRAAGRSLPGMVYARRSYTIAAVWLGLGVFISGRELIPENAHEWRIALLLAFFPTVLGHTPLNAALRHLPATIVSTAYLGEVVGAGILVWLILDEVPPPAFWVGGPAIVAGIVVVALRRPRARGTPPVAAPGVGAENRSEKREETP